MFQTIGKYNQALLIIDHYESILIGDDNGNLSKIPFQRINNKKNTNKPKNIIHVNPLKDYENIKEKIIELKGLERLKNMSFE